MSDDKILKCSVDSQQHEVWEYNTPQKAPIQYIKRDP